MYIYVHISNTNFRNLPLKQNTVIGKTIEWQKGGIRGKMAFLCSILGTITKIMNNMTKPQIEKVKHILKDITSGLKACMLNSVRSHPY